MVVKNIIVHSLEARRNILLMQAAHATQAIIPRIKSYLRRRKEAKLNQNLAPWEQQVSYRFFNDFKSQNRD